MEEILQSIKRIIAEEGDAPAGSDVLELTEKVNDDGSVAKAAAAEAAPKIESMSIEEIIAAPAAPVTLAPAAALPPQPELKPMSAAPADEGIASKETIAKSAAALAALKQVPAPEAPMPPPSGIGFRSGITIETLMMEILKPMLKEWLDANLPGMVERLVEREIKKMSSR